MPYFIFNLNLMKKAVLILMIVFATSFVYGQKGMDQKLNKETNLIEATYYHDNGMISQTGTFNLDGKLHGEWLSYDQNGQKIALGSYDNGLKTGKWYFWSGDSVKEVEYSNNSIASVDGVKKSKGLVDKD